MSGGYSDDEKRAIGQMAQRHMDVITESLQIANKSDDLITKYSRLKVAQGCVDEIWKMLNIYGFLSVTELGDIDDSIRSALKKIDEILYEGAGRPTITVTRTEK